MVALLNNWFSRSVDHIDDQTPIRPKDRTAKQVTERKLQFPPIPVVLIGYSTVPKMVRGLLREVVAEEQGYYVSPSFWFGNR